MAYELIRKLSFDHPYKWDGTLFGNGKLWQPDEIDTTVWLDSYDTSTITESTNAVTLWADKSGKGNNGTPPGGGEPTTNVSNLNDYNILDFDGTERVSLPSGVFSVANGANTVFAVSKRTVDAVQQIIYTLQENAGGFRTVLRYNDAGQVSWRSSGGAGDIFATGVTTTDFNIIAGSYDGITAQELYINGVFIGANTGGVLEPDINLATVGGGATNLELTGSIAEIIVVSSLLSQQDREKVEGYLAWKWNLTTLLAIEHPYKNSPPINGGFADSSYDVIALMGQSNMVGQGSPVDAVLDATNPNIFQWANEVILAQDPLDNINPMADTIGMGMTFAKAHLPTIGSRRVLLVPAAAAGTGFRDNDWNPGDFFFEDALARVNAAVASRTGNVLTHILWHQGEADRLDTESEYAASLDAMLADFRSRATGAATVPFVCGGTLVGGVQTAAGVTAALIDTPNRDANAYYADPAGLVSNGDNLHFDAASLRTFGQRYYDAI